MILMKPSKLKGTKTPKNHKSNFILIIKTKVLKIEREREREREREYVLSNKSKFILEAVTSTPEQGLIL